MKTPDDIKKGLAACSADECHGQHVDCPYDGSVYCTMNVCGDALAYIQQLESRLAQVERERDAAVADFTQYVNYGERECKLCRHKDEVCLNCTWEWRGVK